MVVVVKYSASNGIIKYKYSLLTDNDPVRSVCSSNICRESIPSIASFCIHEGQKHYYLCRHDEQNTNLFSGFLCAYEHDREWVLAFLVSASVNDGIRAYNLKILVLLSCTVFVHF